MDSAVDVGHTTVDTDKVDHSGLKWAVVPEGEEKGP